MNSTHIKKALIIFVCLIVVSFSFLVTAEEGNDSNIFLDSDQDGLSNEEELTYGTDPENSDTDGDGYSDGTEVESGYDPLKPAPGDKILTESELEAEKNEVIISADQLKIDGNENSADIFPENDVTDMNMTEELSMKINELVETSSETGEDIDQTDIDTLISDAMTSDVMNFDDLPEIGVDEIKIKEQDYSDLSEEDKKEKEKEDILEYLVEVAYVGISNSPEKIDSDDDIIDFVGTIKDEASLFTENMTDISYFVGLADKGMGAVEQMKEVEVPEDLLELHVKGLQLSKHSASLKDKIKIDPSDPIGGIAQLSNVQGLVLLGAQLTGEIDSKLKLLGIDKLPLDL